MRQFLARLLIVTEEFADDLGSCLRWGKLNRLLCVTSNRCIPVKNTLDLKYSRVYACDIILLFSLVLCVVRAVHRFDFGHVIKETPNE